MTDIDNDPILPRVEQIDIHTILPNDIIDPSHKERYNHFSETNPDLMREIARRAYIKIFDTQRHSGAVSAIETQKIIIDSITFALSALEEAYKRSRNNS